MWFTQGPCALPSRFVSRKAGAAASLLVALVAGHCWAADAGENPWTADSLVPGVSYADGKLTLAAPRRAWGAADSLGADPLLFWNERGVTAKATIKLKTAGLEPGDTGPTAFIGLVTSQHVGILNSADNVAGLFVRPRPGTDDVDVWLGRKESLADNPAAHGNQWGDVPAVADPVTIQAAGGLISVSLRCNAEGIAVSIDGSDFSKSITAGQLTQRIWSAPSRLAVEIRNNAVGTGAMTVEAMSLDCPRLNAADFHPLNLTAIANGKINSPAGEQWLGMVPYELIAADNGGGNCVELSSSKAASKQADDLAVGQAASSLIFFHTASNAATDGVTAATYRVTYENGETIDIPIIVGQQIGDAASLRDLADPAACLALEFSAPNTPRAFAGIYAYRWINPKPAQPIRSVSFRSADQDVAVKVTAVTAVAAGLNELQNALVQSAFVSADANDLRKNPPDRDAFLDRIVLKQEKTISPTAFSAGGNYTGGKGGAAAMLQPEFGKTVQAIGGVLRYPHGLEINFQFWPYEIKDWYATFMAKGGSYGAIMNWVNKGKAGPPEVITLQTMLAAAKKQGFKLILQLNCTAMFDGKDFIYVKTLPETQMRKTSPLAKGDFDQGNLDRIVANNASLVDYVLQNGYADSIAYWEMDNERWDMPGHDYAATVAANVKMLRSKIPDAKTIVCIGVSSSYQPSVGVSHDSVWSRDLLSALRDMGMNGKIDYFAPHEYPFLKDKADQIVDNYLQDWCIRNVTRGLDEDAAMLDEYGFNTSQMYATEWGIQSDYACCDQSRNDLNTSMAAALAAAKTIMAIQSHPRVAGATLHPFLHASLVDEGRNVPLSKWGEQTLFFTQSGRQITTPPLQAVEMFVDFVKGATLVPNDLKLPAGIQCLAAKDGQGLKYFVVNSTPFSVSFPVQTVTQRKSLFAGSVLGSSIVKYGSFGDKPGEVQEITPQAFSDRELPPFSINVVR